jgi:predicted lipid-binding transport protein (Tim44 family)
MLALRLRPLLAIFALLGAFALLIAQADARPGGGGGAGSRGSRTYTAPPATQTAPTQARPIERSMTQPAPPSAAARPGAPQTGGFFNRPGLLGGLAAGLLGAGLIGMLMGNGFLGGLAGLASIVGFLLQIALLGGLAFLAYRWWQRRSQPQPAFAGGPSSLNASNGPEPAQPIQRSPMSFAGLGALGGGQSAPSAPAGQPTDEIGITPADYDAFEKLLVDIEAAYSNEDLNALRNLLTPEMLSYFSEELADHQSRGVIASLTAVKLLQGDLAEAWREGDTEYASVAIRYEMVDQMLDRTTRQVVEGEARPIEITEIWTFRRSRGGKWVLSAIQQPGS